MAAKKIKRKAPVKQFRAGRVCRMAGCKKRLSLYNSEEYCYAHLREGLTGYKI
jgi:hypothetical protein